MHTRAALTASRSWYQGEEQCIQRGRRTQYGSRLSVCLCWRFTFYAQDFPGQRPMRSIKERGKVYHEMTTNTLNFLALQANTRLTPWLKRGGCACALLTNS
jgi:hypothetical protein